MLVIAAYQQHVGKEEILENQKFASLQRGSQINGDNTLDLDNAQYDIAICARPYQKKGNLPSITSPSYPLSPTFIPATRNMKQRNSIVSTTVA